MHAVLTAEPGELIGRFEIRHPDGAPVALDAARGYRVIRGESPEPLLTQSVYRATGELHWFLTKATPLEDETGGLLAVNVIEDVTEEREAALRSVPRRGRRGALVVARLRGDAAAGRAARGAAARRLVRVELPDERGELQQVALAHADPARIEGRARCASATRPTPTRRSAATR